MEERPAMTVRIPTGFEEDHEATIQVVDDLGRTARLVIYEPEEFGNWLEVFPLWDRLVPRPGIVELAVSRFKDRYYLMDRDSCKVTPASIVVDFDVGDYFSRTNIPDVKSKSLVLLSVLARESPLDVLARLILFELSSRFSFPDCQRRFNDHVRRLENGGMLVVSNRNCPDCSLRITSRGLAHLASLRSFYSVIFGGL